MIGLGTIINIGAIILGGLIGLLCKKISSARYQDTLMQANGLCVLFVGIGGAIREMMKISGDSLVSSGTMMIVASFAAGFSCRGMDQSGGEDGALWKLAER